MLTLPSQRPIIHAAAADGYSGVVTCHIEGPLGNTPTRKIRTHELIYILVKNYRASRGISFEGCWPYVGKAAEKDNRRDPLIVRREEMEQTRKRNSQ